MKGTFIHLRWMKVPFIGYSRAGRGSDYVVHDLIAH